MTEKQNPELPQIMTTADVVALRRAARYGDFSTPAVEPTHDERELPGEFKNPEENNKSENVAEPESSPPQPESNLPGIEEGLGNIAVSAVDSPEIKPEETKPKKEEEVKSSPKGSIFGSKAVIVESPQLEKPDSTVETETTRVPNHTGELEARHQTMAPELTVRPTTVPQELPNRRGSAPESATDRVVKDEARVTPLEAPVLTVVDGGKSDSAFMTSKQWAEFTKKYNEPNNKLPEETPSSSQGPLLFEPPASGKTGSAS